MTLDDPVLASEQTVVVSIHGAECIDELEALWLSLFDHHLSVGPGPFISRVDSWPLRSRFYERILAQPDAFAVLAHVGGLLVGYATVAIHLGADDTWPTGDRFAEVETLAVLPENRGQGIGTLVLDVVDERLAELGVTALFIGVMAGNDDAMRFYRRRGLTPAITKLMRIGPSAGQ